MEDGENPQDTAMREAWEEAGVRAGLTRFVVAYLGKFPDGVLMLRHVWLAEALEGSTFQPALPDEVAEVRFVPKSEFGALYDASLIRMHHTRLFSEDGLREASRRPG